MFEQKNYVTTDHLNRKAYLYIRQSSIKQINENQESTKRQYALEGRAIALGWPKERIIIIDDDQGLSGSTSTKRKGFQQLVAEVGMGEAGMVMGLEVSRLARNSSDWHKLIEICALTSTLVLDEEGIYNPAHFNDRLLLGLKGTMSEAELYMIRARLRGGILNKARRGVLQLGLPLGFIYQNELVVLDHNQQVRDSIQLFFSIFERTESAYHTVKYFRTHQLKFPRRPRTGLSKGELMWGELTHSQALKILHNPRYAGVFFYGRTQQRRSSDGTYSIRTIPREQWAVFLPNTHIGYITQEKFEHNQKILLKNAQSHSKEHSQRPPGEGPALLQGIVACGLCGRRMTLRYHERKGQLYPDYVCQAVGIQTSKSICQSISGKAIDNFIGTELISMMTPVVLEISLAIQQQLELQMQEVTALRKKHVEQATYEADLARRRFMQVDPENRLVANTLEAEWNEKLRLLRQSQEDYENKFKKDRLFLDNEKKPKIMTLVSDFPKLWADPNTPIRERKRMVRLLIEDVTLIKNDNISVGIRFKGGATKSMVLPLPLNAFMARKTNNEIVEEIDQLLNKHTDPEIADILNERGFKTGDNMLFTRMAIYRIRKSYKLLDRRSRLIQQGMLTRREIKKILGVDDVTLKNLKDRGVIKVCSYANTPETILYEPPNEKLINKLNRHTCQQNRRS